jgi:MoaA/NifB/PqqE/SkfB family radical SAM enzyme
MNPLPTSSSTVYFAPGERNVFFHILTACNLACRHCYIRPDQHGTQALDRRTMLDWLELFYDPEKDNNLVFLGGEPTLHKYLAEGVRAARKLGYRSITIDTNGFLFHELLDRITPADAGLNFSLDGPDPTVNDGLRGEGVFDICTANLKKAAGRNFSVGVIYTVSSANIDALHRMPALLADWGARRFFIQVIGLRGKSARDDQRLQVTADRWLETVPAAARRAAERGIEVVYPKVYLEETEPFACAGNVAENFFVFPNGRVYLCPLCEDLPIHAYRIEDGRLLERSDLTEKRLFGLQIPEGCVMNKLLQPGNIDYDTAGRPLHRIACCLLKQRVRPAARP